MPTAPTAPVPCMHCDEAAHRHIGTCVTMIVIVPGHAIGDGLQPATDSDSDGTLKWREDGTGLQPATHGFFRPEPATDDTGLQPGSKQRTHTKSPPTTMTRHGTVTKVSHTGQHVPGCAYIHGNL